MLRGNLSLRPFYNERLVNVALGAIAIVAVLLTAFNTWRLVTLSAERGALRAGIDRNRDEAEKARDSAQALQASVDRTLLATLASETREANDVIGQRTFSWTAFLGVIERTLPIDVRLVVVSPRVERGVFKVSMTVIARDLSDIDTFVDALRETGQFRDPAPVDQQAKDDGTYGAIIETAYQQGSPPAPPPVVPATGGAR